MESQNPALDTEPAGRKKSDHAGDSTSATNQIHLSSGTFAIPPDPSDDDDPRAVIASEGIQDVWEGVAPTPGDVALDTMTANVAMQLELPPLYPSQMLPVTPVMRSVELDLGNAIDAANPVEQAERDALLQPTLSDAMEAPKAAAIPHVDVGNATETIRVGMELAEIGRAHV